MSNYVVMFSSGAGSWYAAKLLVAEVGASAVTLLFCDTKTEDEDNYRFLREAAADVGAELVTVADGRDVWQVFRHRKMIGNTRASTCSYHLKQRPARDWLADNTDDTDTVVLGIDAFESHRMPAVERQYAPHPVRFPLAEQMVEREAVFAHLAEAGIARPRLYDLGFAHANCGGFCVRAGHGQFAHLLRTLPERYAAHEAEENAFREASGKDVAILRDRRGGATTPLTMTALRERIEATPEQVDLFDLGGCGCFVDDGDGS